MDESAEQREIATEIDNLISGAISADDEADINAELEALLDDETTEVTLPSVPTTEPLVLPNVPNQHETTTEKQDREMVPA